jgi:hypothetical protein
MLLERVTFQGPVASDLRLDMPELLHDGLEGWQQGWGAEAARAAKAAGAERNGWIRLAQVSRENGMLFDVDTYAGAGLPDSLAYLPLMPDHTNNPVELKLLGRLDEIVRPLTVSYLELRLFDFGVVVVCLTATAVSPPAFFAHDAVRWVEGCSSAICEPDVGLTDWCAAALRDLSATIPPELLNDDRPLRDGRGVWAAPKQGQIQWLHRIPVLCRPSADHLSLCSDVEDVFGIDCSERVDYRFTGHRATVVPCQGTSIVVVDDGNAKSTVEQFSKIVCLQSAYWAAGQELGSAILKASNDFAIVSRGASVGRIRREGYRLVRLSQQFSLFESLLSEHVTRLAPSELTLWEHTARAWDLPGFLHQVDKRVADFGLLGDRFLQRAQDEAASRLNAVVILLTIVSGVGTAAAIVDFADQSGLGSPNTTHILLLALVGAFLGAFVLAMTTLRSRRR